MTWEAGHNRGNVAEGNCAGVVDVLYKIHETKHCVIWHYLPFTFVCKGTNNLCPYIRR